MTISARELSFGYRRDAPILEDVSMTCGAGEVIGVTGVSGRGKSTLLYLLAGMLTPWRGVVEFRDQPLQAAPDHERSRIRARSFGFVFQDAALDPRRSVLDAVLEPALYAGADRKRYVDRACELLERLGVSLRPEALPGEISGGQAQRVGLCRALLLDPAVVFADEPTGNLDSASANAVMGALTMTARAGGAVVIATHDERVIGHCTRVVRL
ncbi:MAG TPA: ATP-binding cassette domain-containing protein [Micromonosporaceae bacterium]|nr:ATP-binding cassette domain-containing protein [Micromonosporaceae bacterium]